MVSKDFFLGFGVSSVVTDRLDRDGRTVVVQRAQQKEEMIKLQRIIERVGCNNVFEAYNDPE
jgi:hypothetical protein